jgi:hypothetical protein
MIAEVNKMAGIMLDYWEFISGFSRDFSPLHQVQTGPYPVGTGMVP